MSNFVRISADTPLSDEDIHELEELAKMPDSEIRTDLIPERRFNLALAAERRKVGWKPGVIVHKKAS